MMGRTGGLLGIGALLAAGACGRSELDPARGAGGGQAGGGGGVDAPLDSGGGGGSGGVGGLGGADAGMDARDACLPIPGYGARCEQQACAPGLECVDCGGPGPTKGPSVCSIACQRNEDCACAGGEGCLGGICIPPGAHCCPLCVCASPDTPIATPEGERPIASLAAGDLVLSVDRGRLAVVPLARTSRVAAVGHHVVEVTLAGGRRIEISEGHPTADGRSFADLRPGDRLGDAEVVGLRSVAYRHSFTYDILPASDTGSYFAAGALVGSTLAR